MSKGKRTSVSLVPQLNRIFTSFATSSEREKLSRKAARLNGSRVLLSFFGLLVAVYLIGLLFTSGRSYVDDFGVTLSTSFLSLSSSASGGSLLRGVTFEDDMEAQRRQASVYWKSFGGVQGAYARNDSDSDGRWVRAPLIPNDLGDAKFMRLKERAVPWIGKFVAEVSNGKKKILDNDADRLQAANIARDLKVYVSPVSDHTLFCLNKGGECGGTLGSWDKIVWLFMREVFGDVKPHEADFVLLPYFHYCFFYHEGCYAKIGRRRSNTMDTLSLIYNETIDHLDDVAPGRNWSMRTIVPLSHDFGGCVNFALTAKDKAKRIKGQPPILRESVVLQAFGDFDEPCYFGNKDIIVPAFVDYKTIDAEVLPPSERRFFLYFGGTLRFDLRKPGLRNILTNPENYQHLDQHVLGYVAPRSNYSRVLHDTIFCLGPPGVVGWTGRVWEALWTGCIPVFLTENTAHPWEDYLEYDKFSLHFKYTDAERIEELLMAIPDETRASLQREGQRLRNLFVYKPPYNQDDGPLAYIFKSLRRRKRELGL